MCKVQIVALLVVLSGASLASNKKMDHQVNSTCPTWTNYDPLTGSCECGVDVGHTVSCFHTDKKYYVAVLFRFCMTLNKNGIKEVVGSCPFNIARQQYRHSFFSLIIPTNVNDLDQRVCGYTDRTGQLCGQCVNGTSPPVYSYYPQCVDCPAGTNNWAKYLAVSLLPTTLFFLGALLLRFRATSPHLNGYILLCQIATSPIILRRVGQANYAHHYQHNYIGIAGDVYFSFLSVWNLDFFRFAYTPFCLHPNASTLQILSLDYITAVYPLLLIILTYTLVTLHYQNCRLVVWLWKPFLRCCIHFQRQWDIQNSLVDAFATFLLLSYVKLLSVSIDILAPTVLFDSRSERQPIMLYYDGTVEYLSKEHLPYAILSTTVLTVFILFPILLLCLYPCRCFQTFLNNCHINSQALRVFMDAFQGCFKDGTNGTRDCRYFSAVYLILRIAVNLSLILSFVYFTSSVVTAVLVIVILLHSLIHPYKKKLYNQLDIFFFVSLTLSVSSAWIIQERSTGFTETADRVILLLYAPMPIIYPLCLLLYHIWKKSKRLRAATEWIRAFFSRSNSYQYLEQFIPQ